MGMGSFAVNSFVIGYDDLKNICPNEIAAIENEKYFNDLGWETMAKWLAWDDIVELEEAILDVLDDGDDPVDIAQKYNCHITNLKNAFEKKTGLTLYFDHYDEDSGDRYDEPGDKDGCIFCVSGMMVLSPAGEKFKDIITERRWTQYG
jgi:hypothetical protein